MNEHADIGETATTCQDLHLQVQTEKLGRHNYGIKCTSRCRHYPVALRNQIMSAYLKYTLFRQCVKILVIYILSEVCLQVGLLHTAHLFQSCALAKYGNSFGYFQN